MKKIKETYRGNGLTQLEIIRDLRLTFVIVSIGAPFVIGALFDARWPFWLMHFAYLAVLFLLPEPKERKRRQKPEREFEHFQIEEDHAA